MNPELPEALARLAQRSEATLAALLPAADAPPQRLHQAMRYAVLGGGKRMRPLLVYATGNMLGADESVLDHIAAAVELIHAYSLVHDDLPAMDDDDLRRGRPTCHRAFDEATAILAGDALQCLAFQVLADAPQADSVRLDMLRTLAAASGAGGMAGGQAVDLGAVGIRLDLTELEAMHRMKTGALIRACVRLAALAASARPEVVAELDGFADALGLAFQIRDDILDVEGTAEQLGKSAGKDAMADKPTYATLLGVDGARRRLDEEVARIDSALSRLDPERSALLVTLAEFAVRRDF